MKISNSYLTIFKLTLWDRRFSQKFYTVNTLLKN